MSVLDYFAKVLPDEAAPAPPHVFNTLAEGRFVYEYLHYKITQETFYACSAAALPRSDGHTVLVYPGFTGDDSSTVEMRIFLKRIGYEARGWGLGENITYDEERELQILDALEHQFEKSRSKISLVGWSFGGYIAREIAKLRPQWVRCVITLGSPTTDNPDYSHPDVRAAFEEKNAARISEEITSRYAERIHKIPEAPPVPTTSIFSRTDGVLSWRASVQDPDLGVCSENIIVPGSHIGLGFNQLALFAIADRLSQDPTNWKSFERSGWRKILYDSI